jgi:hypothetical protein
MGRQALCPLPPRAYSLSLSIGGCFLYHAEVASSVAD